MATHPRRHGDSPESKETWTLKPIPAGGFWTFKPVVSGHLLSPGSTRQHLDSPVANLRLEFGPTGRLSVFDAGFCGPMICSDDLLRM